MALFFYRYPILNFVYVYGSYLTHALYFSFDKYNVCNARSSATFMFFSSICYIKQNKIRGFVFCPEKEVGDCSH